MSRRRAVALWLTSLLWALLATAPGAAQAKESSDIPPETTVIELAPEAAPDAVEEDSLIMLVSGAALGAGGSVLAVGGAVSAAAGFFGLGFLPLQPGETTDTRQNVRQGLIIGGVAALALGLVSVVFGSGLIVGHYVLE